MTMLQIKKLSSVNHNITCDEQQQVFGGYKTTEELWEGYADGDYDIGSSSRYKGNRGNFIEFTGTFSTEGSDEERTVGTIDLDTREKAKGLFGWDN